ncbi:acetyl-coenzyme A transporter 1-like isoform X2 [Sipha flava]|uniref:Acetyl-coenzyme A transporter 1-like isoform X2 n=1 Tax=Sipha flava TaxID=143950 RepID=A0A8B8F921_9HEMI|nr:acetyl-coenzyme A transporter 1-like isoform X2 [Sipha flava]
MSESIERENKSEKYAVAISSISNEPNLKGDWKNFFLLLLLYTMQGLPLGLISSIPVLLKSNKNVSYNDQAIFNVVMLPYTLKLLWAPLVDSFYVKKIGRRKSWLIPIQFLMGSCFFYISNNINELLPETEKPNIPKLVYVFFITTFMIATQDIVVDGWSLTILKRHNVGYASTCNTTGLAIGLMIGSTSSVLCTSEKFCNKYLRSTHNIGGIVTLKSLLYAWGILFMFVTILVGIFKKEKDCTLEDDHVTLNISQNYLLLRDIFKLRSIQILGIALLTVKTGFAAADHVSPLKLIDAGVSKDDIVFLNSSLHLIKIIVPLVVAKYTSGPKPMNVYLKATFIKLFWNLAFIVLIYYTPSIIQINNEVNIPKYYYVILLFIFAIQEILSYTIFIASLAFFSRISDTRFGGTYMTLLNTLSNLGGIWSSIVMLKMVDYLTLKKCSIDSGNYCLTQHLQNVRY